MNVAREAIMSALFTLLSDATFAPLSDGATSFVTKSRRLKVWTDVPEQPAIYMAEHSENPTYQAENSPQKNSLDVEVFVYFKTPATDEIFPSIDLNRILDGIDAAIAPSVATGTQTLGGLVSHCRIEGKVLKDPGDIDGQGLAVIPIKILVP